MHDFPAEMQEPARLDWWVVDALATHTVTLGLGISRVKAADIERQPSLFILIHHKTFIKVVNLEGSE